MLYNSKTKRIEKLKRTRILKTWDEYAKILSQGERTEDNDLTMFFFKKNGKLPRLGILVSKRLGKSVKRNRVKRLIKEGYRLNQELFSSQFDIIIKAKKDISHLCLREIEAKLIKLGEEIRDNQGEVTIGKGIKKRNDIHD